MNGQVPPTSLPSTPLSAGPSFQPPAPKQQKQPLVLPAAALVFGFLFGFFLQSVIIPQEKGDKTAQLAVPQDTLSNPLFYNWQAIVRGEVVEVSTTSITLQTNGESISLPIAPTAKALRFTSGKDSEQFPLADLKTGETIAARVLFTDGKPEISGAQVLSSEE